MFSIGEFSKITGLTIKTLRFYHEKGVLTPTRVDAGTGYRWYAPAKVEVARVIAELRKLEFTLSDIAEILSSFDDESDILDNLQRQKSTIDERLRQYRNISQQLDRIIISEREVRSAMQLTTYEVEEQELQPVLIAGVRMRGRYSDCGRGFAQIGRRFGRYVCGKPMLLHYDSEYKADDADFEACMPISRGASRDGIEVRELAGGRCVSLLHKGPYEELGRSYERVFAWIRDRDYQIVTPTREIYVKGPGMIFKGNPDKYVTEIQVLIVTPPVTI
jgi:DNA-binding transcriptional MerR regulator/effector-binding domain-containing protein